MFHLAESPAVEVNGVSKCYPASRGGQLVVFAELDLTIEQGEIVCLVGPSGCGKTTLLHILAGLEPATDGEAFMHGLPIDGPAYQRGIVFQDPCLMPWLTVRQNIAFGLELRRIRPDRRHIDALIQLVGLEGFEDSYPAALSGGMAQRVSLARTLANEPQVLLLDEPFAALDAFTRAQLQDEIVRIVETLDVTAVFVTHDIEEAVYTADRVAVMGRPPAALVDVVSIDLPRPRQRQSREFQHYRQQILDLVAVRPAHNRASKVESEEGAGAQWQQVLTSR